MLDILLQNYKYLSSFKKLQMQSMFIIISCKNLVSKYLLILAMNG